MRRSHQWMLFVAAIAALLTLPAMVPAKGKKKGNNKIYISPKACPDSVYAKGSGTALVNWFKSHRKFEVWEKNPEEVEQTCTKRCADEETEEKTKKCMKKCEERESGWDFWILVYLKKPLDDLELTISFYDVEVEPKHLVNSFDMMLYKKGDKIITQRIRLHRPEFEANHRYMIRVTSKQVIKAEQEFNLRGVPVVYSGVVDFTEGESE